MLLARGEIRHARVRFGLLAGAIGLLIFLVFFQQTLLSSLLDSFTGALQNQSATVLVYSADARNSLEGSVVSAAVVAEVAAVPGVGRRELAFPPFGRRRVIRRLERLATPESRESSLGFVASRSRRLSGADGQSHANEPD